jgi:hypothetical protein
MGSIGESNASNVVVEVVMHEMAILTADTSSHFRNHQFVQPEAFVDLKAGFLVRRDMRRLSAC